MSANQEDKFTRICSTITVQSQQEGFFNEFYDCVRNDCGDDWIIKEFAKLKSDREKLHAIFEDPYVCGIVLGTLEHVRPVYKAKDAKVSLQRRSQADGLLQNGDLKNALILYSQAVIRAPAPGANRFIDNGLSLPLALWNRSKVLLTMGEYDKCIEDLQYSAKSGFPIKHQPEYYWRLANCYTHIGEFKKAAITYGLTHKLLEGETEKQQLLQEDMNEMEQLSCENSIVRSQPPILPRVSEGENPTLPSASVLLRLEEKQNNRYVVAAKPIHSGDTVLVEEPIAACLLPKYFGSHCYECFRRLVAPIGCSNCSGIAFCSVECKDKAYYHKYECEYLDLLIGSGMSILCHIALRIILQTENKPEKLDKVRVLLKELCQHSAQRKPHDYLQRTLMSGFLLRFLQHAEFFGIRKTAAVTPTDKELDVGALIVGLLQALQFNAHEVYETKLGEKHRFSGSFPSYIGAAIYKTGSLFNHDCNPGVARVFHGKNLVFHATRPVAPGKAVSENYGPIFTKKNLGERQRSLKSRYWFSCECTACIEDWPVLDKLKSNPRYRCPTENCKNILYQAKVTDLTVKCVKCKSKVNLKFSMEAVGAANKLFKSGAEFMEMEKTHKAIECFKEGIDLFYQVAVPPLKELHIAQESLRVCYGDLGNTFRI